MRPFLQTKDIPIDKVNLSHFGLDNQFLYIKREDLIHPSISGNKYRKLKYNILEAQLQHKTVLLTFGGAYSNHIAAVAAVGKEFSLKTIGIIRGEELIDRVRQNPTLSFAENCGMELHFISREEYRNKGDHNFIEELNKKFGDFYLIPEGGTNALAVKGCQEILDGEGKNFDVIGVPVGTGGTMAGLVKASSEDQAIIGFSVLKGTFQREEIAKHTSKSNFQIIDSYCFGGYGKIDMELIRFINVFKQKTGIQLDPIYTGKMIFGIVDLMKKRRFNENSRIFAIHTGGLQGIAGMNQVLLRKKLPIIE